MKKVTSSDFDIVVDALIVPSKTRHSTPSKSNHSMKKVASSQSEEEDVDKMIALSKNNHDTTDTIKSAAMELKVDGDKLKIPKKCLIKDSSDAVKGNVMPKLLDRLKKNEDECQKILPCYKSLCLSYVTKWMLGACLVLNVEHYFTLCLLQCSWDQNSMTI